MGGEVKEKTQYKLCASNIIALPHYKLVDLNVCGSQHRIIIKPVVHELSTKVLDLIPVKLDL